MASNQIKITNKGDGKKAKKEKAEKKPSSFSKARMWGVTILLLIVLSILAFFLFVNPQWQRVGVAREFDVMAAENKLEQRKSYLKQLQELENNFEKLDDASIALLQQILPSNQSVPELFAQVEVMARQSGVRLQSIQVSEVEEVTSGRGQQVVDDNLPDDVKKLRVQLRINAFDYPSFKEFIRVLETHNRIIDVENFGFQSEKEDQNIQFQTYFIQR